MQSVVTAGWQAPAPSQVRAETLASPAQPGGAHCVPDASGEHWPSLPGRLHERQLPMHAALQQTPCGAQKPELQSVGDEQGWPSARLPQLPLVHTAGAAQPFAGGVQLVAQAVLLPQVYGAHELEGGDTQLPLPSQAGA